MENAWKIARSTGLLSEQAPRTPTIMAEPACGTQQCAVRQAAACAHASATTGAEVLQVVNYAPPGVAARAAAR
ncbi:hypothetical protein PATSB16_07980 [Pandoraea thiooxydans]|nr:hypothetical protein PATSB16_07980 [Pandoraea thiooxydans]